jgi:hypothetical protein
MPTIKCREIIKTRLWEIPLVEMETAKHDKLRTLHLPSNVVLYHLFEYDADTVFIKN